jgi:hypothetical protein
VQDFKNNLSKAKRVKRELKVHLSNLPSEQSTSSEQSSLVIPEFTADDLLEALSPTSLRPPGGGLGGF